MTLRKFIYPWNLQDKLCVYMINEVAVFKEIVNITLLWSFCKKLGNLMLIKFYIKWETKTKFQETFYEFNFKADRVF